MIWCFGLLLLRASGWLWWGVQQRWCVSESRRCWQKAGQRFRHRPSMCTRRKDHCIGARTLNPFLACRFNIQCLCTTYTSVKIAAFKTFACTLNFCQEIKSTISSESAKKDHFRLNNVSFNFSFNFWQCFLEKMTFGFLHFFPLFENKNTIANISRTYIK